MSIKTWLHCIKSTAYFFLGIIIVIPGFIGYVLLTVPFYIYRLFVSHILKNTAICPDGITNIVSAGFGTNYAAEFLTCTAFPARTSTNSITPRHFVKGRIPENKVRQMIQDRWLEARNPNGKYKYPQFHQYIVSWLGCMFWKNDSHFDLDNHFKVHYCANSDLEKYTEDLMCKLLNKPFERYRSPWEIHVVYSCTCSTGNVSETEEKESVCKICGRTEMTVFISRAHHCLGDGLSLIFTMLEGLFNCQLIKSLAKQKSSVQRKRKLTLSNNRNKNSCNSTIALFAKEMFRFGYDMGFVVVFCLFRVNNQTSLHISPKKRLRTQVTGKSIKVPIEQIKQIKNYFGVSFSSVLLSCVSAATAKQIAQDKQSPYKRSMLIAMPVPLPGHPLNKLVNHL